MQMGMMKNMIQDHGNDENHHHVVGNNDVADDDAADARAENISPNIVATLKEFLR